MKRLDKKVAVVYGDGGIGKAIAKGFAQEGARVFLAGRTASKLAAIKDEIIQAGGKVETAVVDALKEQAVEEHLHEVIRKAGKVDISFNAIGVPQTGIQGTALAELPLERFLYPIQVYSQVHFTTARAAIRQMVKQEQGVVMMHTPNAGRLSEPFIGGMPSAWSSVEALCRSISVEYGPYGLRSVCLLTTAIPQTPLIDEVFNIHGKAHGTDYEKFRAVMESKTHKRRLTSLEDLVSSAIFAASDEGAGITGTILNLTGGGVVV